LLGSEKRLILLWLRHEQLAFVSAIRVIVREIAGLSRKVTVHNKSIVLLNVLCLTLASTIAQAQSNGVTLQENKSSYVVNTGGGLVFEVSRKNGDLLSIKYKNRECQAPFTLTQRYSHYASGLSNESIITADKDPAGQWVKVTIDDTKIGLTHYFIARRGEPTLYMADYAEQCPPPGEMRFILYMDRKIFTKVPAPSDISLSDSTIEGKDVFRNSKTGTTYSKFYNGSPIIDGVVHGITGPGIGCFMHMGNRETSSGGPFFRDIENQSGGAAEFYNYMFSGHTQTEPFRPGLKGPHALQFTDGPAPKEPNYAFIETLGLKGYVPAMARGALSGRVSGVAEDHRATVALANAAAQYWANPDKAGKYAIGSVLPGTYTQTLYDRELAVASRNVTIEAGKTASADLAASLLIPPAIFGIGTWDGTPSEFMNGDKIHDHHPSDSIMKPFVDGNFTIGKSRDADWPLGMWREVNSNQRITFTLTPQQAKTPLTLRIGITLAFSGGRPFIDVNAGAPGAWTSKLPPQSEQPQQSRGITRGTYRGNNDTFAFDLPATSLRAGANTIDIHVNSGNKSTPGFLAPAVTFDAIDLVTTADAKRAAATVPPKKVD
jgi:rhamnogalacturonan endolyase